MAGGFVLLDREKARAGYPSVLPEGSRKLEGEEEKKVYRGAELG